MSEDWPEVTIDDAFITIHGVTPDGGDHLIPRWLRKPLLAALLSDAPVVEVRRVGTTIIEIEPVVFHVEPGKYRLVEVEDDHG